MYDRLAKGKELGFNLRRQSGTLDLFMSRKLTAKLVWVRKSEKESMDEIIKGERREERGKGDNWRISER